MESFAFVINYFTREYLIYCDGDIFLKSYMALNISITPLFLRHVMINTLYQRISSTINIQNSLAQ